MYVSDLRLPHKLKSRYDMPPVGLEVDRYNDSTFLGRSKQEYGLFFASFDLFTAKGGQSQNLNVMLKNK